MGRHDSFDRLAKAMAQVYNDDSADGIFEGGYEEQVRRPAFLKMLSFNCFVMDRLHSCGRGGCRGCVADDLFDALDAEMDAHTGGIINCARRLIAERHGLQPKVLDGLPKAGGTGSST